MADSNKINSTSDKEKSNIISSIKGLLNNVKSKTYFSNGDEEKALKYTQQQIDDTIDHIMTYSKETNSGANISKLYERLVNQQVFDGDLKKSLEDMFTDNSFTDGILTAYMQNRHVRDLRIEIDTVCRYLPVLEDALELKKDNVLSSDDFTRDMLNVKALSKIGSGSEVTDNNIKELKRKYNLVKLLEDTYKLTDKYGEDFIYMPPIGAEIQKLIDHHNKNKFINNIDRSKNPFLNNIKSTVTESAVTFNSDDSSDIDIFTFNDEEAKIFKNLKEAGFDISFNFNSSNIIESAVSESSIILEGKNSRISKKPMITNDDIDFDSFKNEPNKDGFININKEEKNKDKINISGALVKRLKPENIIPLYIDETPLGFLHIESSVKNPFDYMENINDPIRGFKKLSAVDMESKIKDSDNLLKSLAMALSDKVDAKFINSNYDLSNEIYTMLKYNFISNNTSKMGFTIQFIPPEHMFHVYFDKDPLTNRGISGLAKALIPAKIAASLYVSDSIGLLTRSHDKRAYFVKQYVDTNISGLLMNVLNQLKRGNMGLREIESLNTILGFQGRFSDYIIPVSQDGTRGIEFEIIPGQDINPKTEFLENITDMAVSTIVPPELVTQKMVDYATRLTMTNTKFMRSVMNRQVLVENIFSKIISRLYNLEYNENEEFEVILPVPMYLNIDNFTTLFNNSVAVADGITELEMNGENFEALGIDENAYRGECKKEVVYYLLGTYLNRYTIEKLKNKAKLKCVLNNRVDNGEE